jgi:glutamyl-tRNA synthetase
MTDFQSIRVRFAPSPTGYLHVGGLRTALYNYLFARKNKGVFILRIEDTDRTRYVPGAVENLIDTLHWAGLTYDEGPGVGGRCGPYIQSERLDIYLAHVRRLIDAGHAYPCFCTPDRLDEMRRLQEKEKASLKYDRYCLRLQPQEIEANLAKGIPHVIRLKVPDDITLIISDEVRGEVEFTSERIDDQVLFKSDGYPTYHLANVVDDHLMGITHVIRGEEWLSSTPKHVLLYKFFGWELPKFAHLPLLLNPDRSKLSKRQGDVAVEDYRGKGYLKEALINFIAFLGWNPGDVQEIFTIEELIEKFSIEKINKSGSIFNLEKLNWLNFEHLRRKTDEEVLAILREYLASSMYRDKLFTDHYLLQVIHVMRERISFIKDFIEKSPYFFEAPISYDPDAVKKRWLKDTPDQMKALINAISPLQNPGKENYENALQTTAATLKITNGQLIHPLRLAISGVGGGPGVFDILEILGKEESIARINSAIHKIDGNS